MALTTESITVFSGTLPGQDQAGIDGLPVEEHRAGPALTYPTAFLGPGQPQLVAEQIDQTEVGSEAQ